MSDAGLWPRAVLSALDLLTAPDYTGIALPTVAGLGKSPSAEAPMAWVIPGKDQSCCFDSREHAERRSGYHELIRSPVDLK